MGFGETGEREKLPCVTDCYIRKLIVFGFVLLFFFFNLALSYGQRKRARKSKSKS